MPVRKDFHPGEFCWVDLAAHDLGAALAWYGELFGWSHQMVPTPGGGPPYAFVMQGEHAIAGAAQMSDEMQAQGIPPMWNSYVATDDCEAFEAKVKELGGTVTVPTMEVPGFGKLAFFLDPGGASFAAWETTSSAGPGMLVNEPCGLTWNELMTRDSDQAKSFYGALTGWTYEKVPMGDVEYDLLKRDGQDAGGMMKMTAPEMAEVPPHWMLYFSVADCDEIASKVTATGGKVVVPPMDIPVGRFALLGDPQGAMFSVITLSEQPPC